MLTRVRVHFPSVGLKANPSMFFKYCQHFSLKGHVFSTKHTKPYLPFLLFLIIVYSASGLQPSDSVFQIFVHCRLLHNTEYLQYQQFPGLHSRSLLCILYIVKEINPGISLEGMMLKLKLQYFGHLMPRVDSLEKTDAGGQEEKGTTEDEMAGWHHGLDGRESE